MKTTIKALRTIICEILNEIADWQGPEYESIESFVEYVLDDEVEEYTHNDLTALNRRLNIPTHVIRDQLDDYGLTLVRRAPEKKTRGFNTSSNDRWYGPGSCKTHGGAGLAGDTGRATVMGKTI